MELGDSNGSSWISNPTPCPVPCMNHSSYPAGGDEIAAHGIDLAGGDAGPHRGKPGDLGVEQEVVEPLLLRRRIADDEATGHVEW